MRKLDNEESGVSEGVAVVERDCKDDTETVVAALDVSDAPGVFELVDNAVTVGSVVIDAVDDAHEEPDTVAKELRDRWEL